MNDELKRAEKVFNTLYYKYMEDNNNNKPRIIHVSDTHEYQSWLFYLAHLHDMQFKRNETKTYME